jgi:hypothetical protein
LTKTVLEDNSNPRPNEIFHPLVRVSNYFPTNFLHGYHKRYCICNFVFKNKPLSTSLKVELMRLGYCVISGFCNRFHLLPCLNWKLLLRDLFCFITTTRQLRNLVTASISMMSNILIYTSIVEMTS